MYSDGGARSNPGPAAVGFVIYDQNDREIFKGSKYLGVATNNTAEYMALYFGVLKLKSLNCTKVDLYLDSELVVKQMQGKYQVKKQDLGKIKDKIVEALNGIEWSITHVRREKNKVADALVNQELDKNH
jgi:ribonuclease HI